MVQKKDITNTLSQKDELTNRIQGFAAFLERVKITRTNGTEVIPLRRLANLFEFGENQVAFVNYYTHRWATWSSEHKSLEMFHDENGAEIEVVSLEIFIAFVFHLTYSTSNRRAFYVKHSLLSENSSDLVLLDLEGNPTSAIAINLSTQERAPEPTYDELLERVRVQENLIVLLLFMMRQNKSAHITLIDKHYLKKETDQLYLKTQRDLEKLWNKQRKNRGR
jgi:hypothetical protein